MSIQCHKSHTFLPSTNVCVSWWSLVGEIKVIRLESSWNREDRTYVGCGLSSFPVLIHCWCFMLLWTFPKWKKGWCVPLLAYYFGYQDFSYSTGLLWSHQTFFLFVLQNAFDSTRHLSHLLHILHSCRFYYLHMFFCACVFQIYHKPPSAHLWLGLLILYLGLPMLQSANSGISMLQIAHTVLLVLLLWCVYYTLLQGKQYTVY